MDDCIPPMVGYGKPVPVRQDFLPFLFETFSIPLQDALGLTKTQLGSLMSVFGTTSLIFCFPGGWLDDRVSPRKLILFTCLSTNIGGS